MSFEPQSCEHATQAANCPLNARLQLVLVLDLLSPLFCARLAAAG